MHPPFPNLRTGMSSPAFHLLTVLFCAAFFFGCRGSAAAHGSLDAQIAAFTEALAAKPADPELLLLRANAHGLHKDWPAAAQDIAAAEKAGANAGLVALARAGLAVAQGDWDAAARELPVLKRELPEHVDAWRLAALVHTTRGEKAGAVAVWRTVIGKAAPPRPDDVISLARALHATGADDEAIAALEAGAQSLGEISVFLEEAAQIEEARRQWDAALARLDRLLAQSPNSPRWLARKAALAERAARPALAAATRRAALEALEALPLSRRSTPAFAELEQTLRAQLARPASPRSP